MSFQDNADDLHKESKDPMFSGTAETETIGLLEDASPSGDTGKDRLVTGRNAELGDPNTTGIPQLALLPDTFSVKFPSKLLPLLLARVPSWLGPMKKACGLWPGAENLGVEAPSDLSVRVLELRFRLVSLESNESWCRHESLESNERFKKGMQADP